MKRIIARKAFSNGIPCISDSTHRTKGEGLLLKRGGTKNANSVAPIRAFLESCGRCVCIEAVVLIDDNRSGLDVKEENEGNEEKGGGGIAVVLSGMRSQKQKQGKEGEVGERGSSEGEWQEDG
jgi:hypothetical protein